MNFSQIQRDIEGWLENSSTLLRPDLSYPVGVVSQFMQNPHIDHWNAVIRILRYVKGNPGQGLLYENKGSTQVVHIVMQIGLVVQLIEDLPQGIVYSLEGTLFLGKVRNKVLLLDLVQRQNIDLWL